jgi:hypothetical protein
MSGAPDGRCELSASLPSGLRVAGHPTLTGLATRSTRLEFTARSLRNGAARPNRETLRLAADPEPGSGGRAPLVRPSLTSPMRMACREPATSRMLSRSMATRASPRS